MLDWVFAIIAWGLLSLFCVFVVYGVVVAATTLVRFYLAEFAQQRENARSSELESRGHVPAE